MTEFSDNEKLEAEIILKFYTGLVETKPDIAKYYMTEDIVIDWFGKTIKGQKNLNVFLKSDLSKCRHHFTEPAPAQSIGFRDVHVIKEVKIPTTKKQPPTHLVSPPRISYSKTPKKQHLRPSTSNADPDHLDRNGTTSSTDLDVSACMSPLKKFKHSTTATDSETSDYETLESESIDNASSIKYLTVNGSVEFHGASLKKLQTETKWKRPCKLSIGYSAQAGTTNGCEGGENCTIYLVIYESNVKCRRNLLKEFEEGEPEH